jgi:uncharacterized protein YggE
VAGVTVRGGAEREVEPDRVRLTLSVEAEAARSDQALADLADRAAAVDRGLDETDGVLLRRPSTVRVGPLFGPRGEPRGQVARRSTAVELAATAPLGGLLDRTVEVEGVHVGGLEWLVDPGNPAHAELRAEAVADARARAEVYAQAAGMRLGALEWLAEPGLRPGRPEDAERVLPMARLATMAAESADDGERLLDLKPEPVTVTAAIEASYALLPGAPGQDTGNYL